MAINVTIDGLGTGVLECNLSYSREGYIPLAYIITDNTKIETTLVMDSDADPIFSDNLEMAEGWSGTATAEEKEEDPTKTDVYSRFTTDPEDTDWDNVDFESIGRGIPGPLVYRQFTASTFLLDTGGEQVSATARIEDSEGAWKFSGQIGLGARTQDGQLPYLRIQAGNKALEYDNRLKNKMVTLIVEGQSHPIGAGLDSSVELTGDDVPWFIPFNVLSTDRFKRYKVYRSFRGKIIPDLDNSLTDNELRYDLATAKSYILDYVESITIPPISGSITMVGNTQYSVGEKIGEIITRHGATPVNLAIVDQDTQYAPPRQAGGSGQDTVTIELERK